MHDDTTHQTCLLHPEGSRLVMNLKRMKRAVIGPGLMVQKLLIRFLFFFGFFSVHLRISVVVDLFPPSCCARLEKIVFVQRAIIYANEPFDLHALSGT